MSDDFLPDMGPCCTCEKTGADVRNIIMLRLRGPTPGQGWGCFLCGLPSDGAFAVVCDECLAAKRPLLFACDGYLAQGKRVDYASLTEQFDHNPLFHPEMQVENPDIAGDEDDEEDPDGERPARMWLFDVDESTGETTGAVCLNERGISALGVRR